MPVSAARQGFEAYFGFSTKCGRPIGEKPKQTVKDKNLGMAYAYVPGFGQLIYVLALHGIRTGEVDATKGGKIALAIRSICVISVVGLIALPFLDGIGTIMIHCHKKNPAPIPAQDDVLDGNGQ